MRVCLISRTASLVPIGSGIVPSTQALAIGLFELGHHVEIIAVRQDAAKVVLADGIPVHRVTPHEGPQPLHMMDSCLPSSREIISSSAGLWKKFHELHLKRPFDVVDTIDSIYDGLFPAVTRVAPMVIRLHKPDLDFITEQLHSGNLPFDYQLAAILRRFITVSADILTSPSLDLADSISADLNYPRSQIVIPHPQIEFSPDADSSEIARQTADLYEQAIENYNLHPRPCLYLKDRSECLSDTELFIDSFTQNIEEFLRLHSWRERCRYLWSLRAHPDLLAAKALCTTSESLLSSINCYPVWLSELKDWIAARESPVHSLTAPSNRAQPPSVSSQPAGSGNSSSYLD